MDAEVCGSGRGYSTGSRPLEHSKVVRSDHMYNAERVNVCSRDVQVRDP